MPNPTRSVIGSISLLLFAIAFALLAWNAIDSAQDNRARLDETRAELDEARHQLENLAQANTCRAAIALEVNEAQIDYIVILGESFVLQSQFMNTLHEGGELEGLHDELAEVNTRLDAAGQRLERLRTIEPGEVPGCLGG